MAVLSRGRLNYFLGDILKRCMFMLCMVHVHIDNDFKDLIQGNQQSVKSTLQRYPFHHWSVSDYYF